MPARLHGRTALVTGSTDGTVAPGPTVTEKTAALADRIAPILDRAPSRRANGPDEVASAVAFPASDEASSIHGATLSVDGGLSAV